MTFEIDISEEMKARLQRAAAQEGVDAAEYTKRVLDESLPPAKVAPIDRRERTFDLFDRWDREDETDDPEEIERRNKDAQDFMRSMNENRMPGRKLYYT